MSPDDPSVRPIRVLTIEPPEAGRDGIGEQLNASGTRDLVIESVDNIETAIEKIHATYVDCVICLHAPPSIDGLEVLAELREEFPRLPVLFASDSGAADVIQHGPSDVLDLDDGTLNPEIATNRISAIVSRDRGRDKYQQIFEQATDGISVHDPDSGDLLEANHKLYRLLGYQPDSHSQLSLADVVSGAGDYTEAAARDRIRQAANGEPQTFEWLNETAEGTSLWVEVSLKPATISGEDRVLAFVRDISDRKESEELLRDREQQLEAVFDHPSSFAVVLDDTGRILRTNQPALTYIDADHTTVEGRKLWNTPWWDEDGPTSARIQEVIGAALEGTTARLEVEINGDDGRRVLDLRVEPIGDEPKTDPESIIVAGYDITDRIERETDLRRNRDTLRQLHDTMATPEKSLEEQIDQLLTFAADRFGMDIAFVSRIDQASNRFEVVAARGDHELIQAGEVAPLSETYCRHTIDPNQSQPLVIDQAPKTMADDPAFERFNLGCYLGETLRVDGELYGTLCFADEEVKEQPFTDEETTLLDIMTSWLEQELAQRDTQDELEAARDRLEQTLHRIDDGFLAVDEDWEITYTNERGAELLSEAMDDEYDPESLVGRNLWDELPEPVRSGLYERYQEAMETQESVSFEEYYEPLDLWLEIAAYPDEDGLSVYFTDITERMEREQELKTKTEAMETAPVGIILTDPDRNDNPIVYANERFEEMTGYTEDEVLGQNCRLLQGDQTDPAAVSEMREGIDDHRPVSVELRNYRKDGTEFWNEVTIAPVKDESGTVTNWIGFQQDITERKERERELVRLQDLLEQMEEIADVGAWEIDTDTMEVFWSDHLFKLLGVEGDQEPPLDEALDVYHEDDRPRIESGVNEAIENLEPFEEEVRYRRNEDQLRWLRVQAVPVVEDGEAVTIRGAAQDITQQKEYEQTLGELLEVTRQFARVGDHDELVSAITDGLNSVFEYDITSVRLHDTATGTLPPTAVTSKGLEYAPDVPIFEDDEGIPGEVFQTGEATIVGDLTAATERDYGALSSGLFIPLGEHGIIGVGATEQSAFSEEDMALVELLALAAEGAFDRLEREQEMRQLQRIIEHVDEKVFLLDDDGTFQYATPSLSAYLGYEHAELTDLSLGDIIADPDTEPAEFLEEFFTGDGRGRHTQEIEIALASGESRPAEIELSTVRVSGRTREVAGVVTDISELAETRSSLEAQRERFRGLFENLPDPVVEVTYSGEEPLVRYANPAFTDVFGYDREEIRGSNLNDLIVPGSEHADSSMLDEATIEGEATSTAVQRTTEEGRRDFLLRGIPYLEGEEPHAFAIYTDITEQRERERYLQILNRVLRHNLRNDMNVVMALADRLAQNVGDDRLADHARTLHEHAQDVATLSEKAKDIERVLGRRGRADSRVNLSSLVREVIASRIGNEMDYDLTVNLPDELWVHGDDQLRRACEELIENVIEHGDAETPTLEIEAVPDEQAEEWVELRFHDDGPGIPDEEWQIVSGDEEISQLTHGSGLGLWLTRWIVESYGGELRRYQSEDTAGTTIAIRLRRADAPSEASAGESAGVAQ